MTPRITRAHARDLNKVKPLWKQMIQRYRDMSNGIWEVRDPQEAWQRRHQQYLEWVNDASGVVFIAVGDDDAVIGYAALHFTVSGAAFDFGDNFAELESLVVASGHQGEGIGRGLLAACQKELRRREISHWTVATIASDADVARLYERAGFTPFMTRFVQRLAD